MHNEPIYGLTLFRKANKCGNVIATKALGCKMAKAAWYMIRDNKPYDGNRMFSGHPSEPSK